jgi:hypothetical protein
MALTYTFHKSPKDRTYIRTVSSGTVTAEDSAALMAVLAPGQPNAGVPMLSIVEAGAEFTPEARKTFTAVGGGSGEGKRNMVAVVVTSAALRVLISFVLRIAGAADSTKFFATEDEAKKWLFSIVDA